jgi:hypothetical protein
VEPRSTPGSLSSGDGSDCHSRAGRGGGSGGGRSISIIALALGRQVMWRPPLERHVDVGEAQA